MIRARYMNLEGHDVTVILSILPLPNSRYMREQLAEQTATPTCQALTPANTQADAQTPLVPISPGTSSGNSAMVTPQSDIHESYLKTCGWVEDVFASSGDEETNVEISKRRQSGRAQAFYWNKL